MSNTNQSKDLPSRESRMVVIQRDESGTATVWCDPEVADLIRALNNGGVPTVASCSGHGEKPGWVALKDGRQLAIVPDLDAFKRLIANQSKEEGSFSGGEQRLWITVAEVLRIVDANESRQDIERTLIACLPSNGGPAPDGAPHSLDIMDLSQPWTEGHCRNYPRAAAALINQLQADRWRSIATAPKDGTPFLAWFPKVRLDDEGDATDEVVGGAQAIVTCRDGQWDEPEWLSASGSYYLDDWCFADTPTQWMPLPPPPLGSASAPTYTTGHCEHRKQPGGCQLHNLQCGYPACDRKERGE